MRRNRGRVAVLGAGVAGLLAFETYVLVFVLPTSGATWYSLGATHTSMLILLAYGLNASFLAHDRDAILHLRGAWGEENTRSELHRARRKRLIWGWVDSVALQAGDIDHLVVTRRGGLVAIDSKWRNRVDSSDRQEMARSARRAQLRAEAVVRTLLQSERGSHRARSNSLPVRSVVVLWGAIQPDVPEDAAVGGVDFIPGRRLVAWLSNHRDDPVDRRAAADLLDRIERFRTAAWASGTETNTT
jgi:hypothetical protein